MSVEKHEEIWVEKANKLYKIMVNLKVADQKSEWFYFIYGISHAYCGKDCLNYVSAVAFFKHCYMMPNTFYKEYLVGYKIGLKSLYSYLEQYPL